MQKDLDFEMLFGIFSCPNGSWDFEHTVRVHINRKIAVGTTGNSLVTCRASACLESMWKDWVLHSLSLIRGICAENSFAVVLSFSAFL